MIKITTNERIAFLRKEKLKNENSKSYSVRGFAEKLGVSRGVIVNIESNLVEAKDNIINLICLTFNVNEEWLRNGTEPIFNENKTEKPLIDLIEEEYSLSPLAKSVIEAYLKLDKSKRADFEEFATQIFGKNNISKEETSININELPKYTSTNKEIEEELSITKIEDLKAIKFYNTPVSAGTGSFLNDDEAYEIIKVDLNIIPKAKRCDFALRVRGDSMEPYYYDGDIVYIKEQPIVDNGQIGIFIYDGEAYIKEYSVQDDGIYLISINKKYEPIRVNEHSYLKCCGLVL